MSDADQCLLQLCVDAIHCLTDQATLLELPILDSKLSRNLGIFFAMLTLARLQSQKISNPLLPRFLLLAIAFLHLSVVLRMDMTIL